MATEQLILSLSLSPVIFILFKLFILNVYEVSDIWKQPLFCNHCKMIGHPIQQCKKLQVQGGTKVVSEVQKGYHK